MARITASFAVVAHDEVFVRGNRERFAVRQETAAKGGPTSRNVWFFLRHAVEIDYAALDFQRISGDSDDAFDQTAGFSVEFFRNFLYGFVVNDDDIAASQ